jgi:hypothetical protein
MEETPEIPEVKCLFNEDNSCMLKKHQFPFVLDTQVTLMIRAV